MNKKSKSHGKNSKINKTIAFLENLNAWRRGDETIKMPSPVLVGKTIDDAIALLRTQNISKL